MGELHLEIIVDRMRREFKVEANVGKPQVAYRETITRTVKAKVNLLDNLVVVDNMDMFGLNLVPMNQVKDMNLKMQ